MEQPTPVTSGRVSAGKKLNRSFVLNRKGLAWMHLSIWLFHINPGSSYSAHCCSGQLEHGFTSLCFSDVTVSMENLLQNPTCPLGQPTLHRSSTKSASIPTPAETDHAPLGPPKTVPLSALPSAYCCLPHIVHSPSILYENIEVVFAALCYPSTMPRT